MRLLNVGCGAVRPGPPWINLDSLRQILKPGTPERTQLDIESNYVEFDLRNIGRLPWTPEPTFDGILISHVIEHFDCQEAAAILTACREVLLPGGILVVSVPDASYFLEVHDRDTPDRATELFGEPICPGEPWHKSFFDYALFYHQHKQIFTEISLMAVLVRAGFELSKMDPLGELIPGDVLREIEKIMNRRKFSLEMCAVK